MAYPTYRPASEKQISFIGRLVAEKDLTVDEIANVENDVEMGLTTTGASAWIDLLISRRRKPAQQALALGVVARTRVSEIGYYKADDGDVYKVVLSQVGNLYAKKTTAHGLDFVSGAMSLLFADQKMTGEEIAAYGAVNSYCVICSTEFSDPTSELVGIGPKCGTDILGKDAYKALRVTVADNPRVIAFEAAKKAKAKEAREAKKAAEAQLVLV